jgi:hypothetical protein
MANGGEGCRLNRTQEVAGSSPAGSMHKPRGEHKFGHVARSTDLQGDRVCAPHGRCSCPYNHNRVHHGRLTRGRIPADIAYGARKMEAR